MGCLHQVLTQINGVLQGQHDQVWECRPWVVVACQGGSLVSANLWGRGYLEGLQQDAHAWSEVGLADQGWLRIDPIAWVAPARELAAADRQLAATTTRLKRRPVERPQPPEPQ